MQRKLVTSCAENHGGDKFKTRYKGYWVQSFWVSRASELRRAEIKEPTPGSQPFAAFGELKLPRLMVEDSIRLKAPGLNWGSAFLCTWSSCTPKPENPHSEATLSPQPLDAEPSSLGPKPNTPTSLQIGLCTSTHIQAWECCPRSKAALQDPGEGVRDG